MSVNLENFRPRLRNGRVIPQGSRIIFETESPYNQIILPMALADLILLCSGQFSVREIVEKIYKKQGAVPFKSLLKAIHVLHQGGFFENGHELNLNSHLRSWMEAKDSRYHLSWLFGQRVLSERRYPMGFYFVTLLVLVVSMLGLQLLPSSPLTLVQAWLTKNEFFTNVIRYFVCSSLIQSVRYMLRGVQLLLLTGKAYNVSIRLSVWGVHLHVGDEANDLFENRLYTAMFHVSQILCGWLVALAACQLVTTDWLEALLIVSSLITFWEINPFSHSEGFKLVRALLVPIDRDVVSWHFETSTLINRMAPEAVRRDLEFSRICAIWGTVWLIACFSILHDFAINFGPTTLKRVMSPSAEAIVPLLGLIMWMSGLYVLVQALVETALMSLIRPWWRLASDYFAPVRGKKWAAVTKEELLPRIQDLPLFSHFHDKDLLRILEHTIVAEYKPKGFIVQQGDPSRELFILLEGEIEITRRLAHGQSEFVTEMAPTAVFGEAALIEDSPRAAQVRARTHVACLRVPVPVIRTIATESQVIRHLNDFRDAIIVNQFFASSPVFRSLTPESIHYLSSRGVLEYLDQGQIVFRQGDLGDSLYLILRGSIEVQINGHSVKQLVQGSFFGEIALIANIPRTATIATLEPSVLFKISSDAFWEILVQHMDLGVFIETVSETRLREEGSYAIPLKRTGSDS